MKRRFFNSSLITGVSLLAFGMVTLSSCSTTQFVPATVRVNPEALTISVGEGKQLRASVSKGYGTDVRWFTSNENAVYVDEYSGYVLGVGEGTAKITASLGGGYGYCQVTVSGEGGGGTVDYLSINPTSKTIKVGGSFTISHSAYPRDTVVNYSSDNPSVASVVATSGLVTGVAVGTANITATGSNGKTATCSVTVNDGSSGEDYDIAVDTNLGYSGSLTIGSPLNQRGFMQELLNDFNRLTNSNITFTVTTHEEDQGTSGYPDAQSMPAIFPYASDQTLTLYQYNALSNLGRSDYNWVKEQMGESAYNAARLGSNVVGFPFAADNGIVMFYNTDVCSESDIDTLSKLFAKAEETGYDFDFTLGTGFFAAGVLMTYSEGESLYTLTPSQKTYKSSASFNSEIGLAGAKLINKIYKEGQPVNAAQAPTTNNEVLATITDASKVGSFKSSMGSKYAVAPLPYIDDEKTTRLGSYLGYKFYGINNNLSATDKTKASAVAKFLCSEYSQAKRFDQYSVRPTLTSLVSYAENEPHVAAINKQEMAKATIPLTAVASELWSATATAVTSIRQLPLDAPDSSYVTILETLDGELTKV